MPQANRYSSLLRHSLLAVAFGLLQGCGGGGSNTEISSHGMIQAQAAPSETTLEQPETVDQSADLAPLLPQTAADGNNDPESVSGPVAGHDDLPATPEANTAEPEQPAPSPSVTEPAEEAASAEESGSPDIVITYAPQSVEANAGSRLTLNVTATSEQTLHYQWRKDGIPITDGVLPHLALDNLQLDQAGLYDVVISNATGFVISAAAELTVVVDREARLVWTTPTQREDGTSLDPDEISGYRIYHSSEDGLQEEVYEVPAGATHYAVEDLPEGTHYFAISAIDADGLESELSELVSKRVL